MAVKTWGLGEAVFQMLVAQVYLMSCVGCVCVRVRVRPGDLICTKRHGVLLKAVGALRVKNLRKQRNLNPVRASRGHEEHFAAHLQHMRLEAMGHPRAVHVH